MRKQETPASICPPTSPVRQLSSSTTVGELRSRLRKRSHKWSESPENNCAEGKEDQLPFAAAPSPRLAPRALSPRPTPSPPVPQTHRMSQSPGRHCSVPRGNSPARKSFPYLERKSEVSGKFLQPFSAPHEGSASVTPHPETGKS